MFSRAEGRPTVEVPRGMRMANGHGGYREGAGRKPKALKYEPQMSAIEERIVRMLPRVVDKMIEMALDGDLRAGRYLVDRIMGRVPILDAPPAMDRSMPYSEREYKSENLERNLDLCDDEIRLEQRMEDMFEYVGDDDETEGDLIPMSPEETDDLLRKARAEQGQATLANTDAEEETSPQPSPWKGEGEDTAQMHEDVETPESTTSQFIPSDGPDDPDRTWYYPE